MKTLGGGGVTNSLCHFSQMHSPYVLCFENLGYERRLRVNLWQLGAIQLLGWPTGPGKVIRVSITYDKIYFFTNCRYWSRDVDFEFPMGARP